MGEMLKAYGFVGLQQLFIIIYSLLRTKIISTNLGPAGLGMFSQANTLLLLMFQLATFGTTVALNASIAEAMSKAEKEKIPQLMFPVWVLNTLMGVILLIVCGLYSDSISAWAFGSEVFSRYIFITALGSFTFIQVRFFVNVMRGLLEWRAYSLLSSAGILIGLGMIVILVLALGLDGAVWSLVVIQLINLVFLISYFLIEIQKKHKFVFGKIKFDREILFKIFRIARPIMIILILEPLAGFLIRADIIRTLGISSNGEYQVLAGVSLAYMNVIKEVRLTYALPKALSFVEDPEQLVSMQNNNIKIGLYLILPITLGVLTFREFFVVLLYSPAFLAVTGLLVWQFIGDILNVVRTNLNFVLIPLKKYRFYLLEGLAYWVGWIGISALLIGQIGLIAVPVSNILITVIVLAISLTYHGRRFGFQIKLDTLKSIKVLGILGTVGYLAALLLPDGLVRYLCVLVVFAGILISLKNQGVHKLLFSKS